MPARVAAAVELFARVAVVLCSAYLVRHGVELTLRTGLELPTMRISIAWMYAAMPVGIALFVVLEACSLLAWLRAGMPRRAAEVQP
jgi:TRAP-type C4-dicarboxylate transport system permease small subunit